MRSRKKEMPMPGTGDQPDIKEPVVDVGATVWYDEYRTLEGIIVKLANGSIIVNYGERVSSYPTKSISCAYLAPYLVLVADKENETVIHDYT
jgi:hypothetical protein